MIHYIFLIGASMLTALAAARHCAARHHGKFSRIACCTCLIVPLLTLASALITGMNMQAVQTLILSTLLCHISYRDIKTHTVPDHTNLAVWLASLLCLTGEAIPQRLLAGLCVAALLTLAALLPGVTVGGADIKFSAAVAFALPAQWYFLGICLGLMAAFVFNSPFLKRKGAARSYPLLPYLSSGVMASYMLAMI